MAPAAMSAILRAPFRDHGPPAENIDSLHARSVLTNRDDANWHGGSGTTSPDQIPNTVIFVLFGLIGVVFVATGIWFFFWAKNGGFFFKESDWDDYKSTVLRRRGPNGTILSGATPSTQLGGGSVYKDYDENSTERDNSTVISGTTGVTDATQMTGITGGVSDFMGREKRRKKREEKERDKERRREEKAREKEEQKRGKSRKAGPDGALMDEKAEQDAKDHLRKYRHERPARVGGINKRSEASAWDGSTNPSHSMAGGSGFGTESTVDSANASTESSELMSHRERTLTTTPTTGLTKQHRQGRSLVGIRKVYSTADKNASRENERIRAEARRLQERGREAARHSRGIRRDFSFQHDGHDVASGLRSIEEGSAISLNTESALDAPTGPRWTAPSASYPSGGDGGSDLGTKVYMHPVHIPGTSTNDYAYTEEKRRKRAGAGYRRGQVGDAL